MTKIYVFLTAGLLLFLTASCSSGKPDFTGTWVQVGGAPPPGGPYDPDNEPQMTIEQDGATMKMTMTVISKSKATVKAKPLVSTVTLDGSEKHSSIDSVSKTYWKGDTLVFESTQSSKGQTTVMTNVWSMEKSGTLVIDHILSRPDLPEPARLRSTFKKIRSSP
jgi:hypothetical protein